MILENKCRLKKAVSAFAAVASLAIPLCSIAAPGSAPGSPITLGRNAMASKNYARAVQIYESASKTEEYKNNSDCRLGLGKALCKLAANQKGQQQTETYKKAIKELRLAMRLGRGSAKSIEANSVLLSLPKIATAPKTGAETPMIAMANGIRGMERGGGPSKPKILEFYAPWCQPCKQLKPFIEKAKNEYAEQVEFVTYNIDDPKSAKIVEDYEVSPIPTLIFLDSTNQVMSYSIGYSGESGIKAGIKKILPPG